MPKQSHVNVQGSDGQSATWVRVGDCVALVVDDPNGPLLATVGSVLDWDDKGVRVETESSLQVAIPWNTIRSAFAVDGNVVEDIEFDPQRPTT